MKRILIIVGLSLLALIAAVLIYVAYVYGTSYRLPDNLSLEVQQTNAVSASEAVNAEAKVGEEYSVTSVNMGFGANSSDFSFFMDGGKQSVATSANAVYQNIAGSVEYINALNPTIALFQEVDVDGTRSHHINEVDLLTKSLPQYSWLVYAQNYDSPYLAYPLYSPHGANKSGICTFSKFPIQSATRRQLPIESGLTSVLDLDRCYSVSRIPVANANGRELVVYNVHLSAYTTDGNIAGEQIDMLFNDMLAERQKGNWAVAGGDLNKDLLGDAASIFGVSGGENAAWAQPIPEGAIPNGITLVAPYDASNPVASCRNLDRPYDQSVFRLTVDGFFVTDNVEVKSSQVIDAQYKYSDHNPVEMKFALKG